jgi:hypothetical protein
LEWSLDGGGYESTDTTGTGKQFRGGDERLGKSRLPNIERGGVSATAGTLQWVQVLERERMAGDRAMHEVRVLRFQALDENGSLPAQDLGGSAVW